MNSLKALLLKKKQEKQELVGDKKYVRKAELEEAKLKRIREEEQQELRAKEEKKRKLQGSTAPAADGRPATPTDAVADPAAAGEAALAEHDGSAASAAVAAEGAATAGQPALPREEVIRRLRALGQPVTLFGEEDADRQARLRKVEKTVVLADETRGGQQENVLLKLRRQDKMKKGGGQQQQQADGAGGGKADAAAAGGEGPSKAAAAAAAEASASAAGGEAGSAGDDVLAAFKAAAERLAAQRTEEALPVEERMVRMLQRWCKMWEEDLEARSEEVKQSGMGHTNTMVFQQSMTYLEPLYERLRRRQLVEELKVGLWVMIQLMAERNYLAANDVYLKLAIGNAPWPIGVTHVGLHERSAREKISHVMNSSSQAHIMNDEATRKFFQAIKRLMTALQRLCPTDPSRCVDFDVAGDAGRGVAGSGSNRNALLQAQAKGELPLALPAAPHLVAADGSVKIPPKWENVLRRHAHGMGIKNYGKAADSDSDEEQQQQRAQAGTPPPRKTPPKSPLQA
ncbi:Prp18 domain-containing protein [Scenedesmus sp. NREL 46B-D3]|nr:Prp18 domain-containing protein [Scenedesmus sp. NREL 46B-D3]